MGHKQKKRNFMKVFGIWIGIVLLLTFLSKSVYRYRLPVVSVSFPKQGSISFTVEGTAEVSYSEAAEKSGEWTAALFITDEQLEYVDLGSTAEVEIKGVKERLAGEIQSVVPFADQSRTGYLVQILFRFKDMEIAGRQAEITIRKDSPQYDALIPAAALRKDAVGYYVLVLHEDDSVLGEGYAAYRMSVDLLDSDETFCAVRGLPADEKVIVAAASEITDGSKVYYDGEIKP